MTGAAQDRQSEGWLGRLLAGDHSAFAELVDKYKGMVFLCCRALGLRDDEADDVASETFLAAYNGISRYRGQAELSTWLWKIAYYKGISYLRKNKRRGELLGGLDEQIADSSEMQTPAGLESKEQAELIWRAVGRLPGLWAMAVILYYREEKNISEIAKIMRVRQNTVKTYLFRARKRLKQIIGPILGEDIDVG